IPGAGRRRWPEERPSNLPHGPCRSRIPAASKITGMWSEPERDHGYVRLQRRGRAVPRAEPQIWASTSWVQTICPGSGRRLLRNRRASAGTARRRAFLEVDGERYGGEEI